MSDLPRLKNLRGQVLLMLDGSVVRTAGGQELGTVLGPILMNLRGQQIAQFSDTGVCDASGQIALRVEGLALIGPTGDQIAVASKGTPTEVAAMGAAYLAYFSQ